MTRDEHLMVIAMEECDEVSQRISKALRFGMFEVQPGQPDTNHARIVAEYNDLHAVLGMLGLNVFNPDRVRAKRDKVERFLAFSAHCGTLTDGGRVEGTDPSLATLHPDAIGAAVDAQLDPLKDELTAIGHKLAKETPRVYERIFVEGETLPRVDADDVARALGAEHVGPAPKRGGVKR